MVLFFIARVCARWWKAVWTLGAIAVRRTGERGQSYDEFLRCSLLSSARMASVELRCGRLQPVESNLLVCVASRGL